MPSPDKPLITFALFAYNQEKFIREAVEGAFSQTYSPLEIILSDDCSSDRTFEIMKEMAAAYNGPHKIVLNKNPQNLGVGRHYNRVMELASGEIVELAAGDDISLPWRTADSVSILQDHPDITCVSMGLRHFKDSPNFALVSRQEIKPLAKWSLADFLGTPGFFINAPGRAFRKYTHDFYGPLIEQCPVEDGPNLLRCLLHGAAARCENIGVFYRWNRENISSPENISKIPFSLIYADYLNTIEIAFKRGQIDLRARQKLISVFEAKKERSLLLESLHSSRFRVITLTRILASSHFSLKERVKLFLKWFFRLLGLRRCAAHALVMLRRLAFILVTLTVFTHKRRWKKIAVSGRPPWDSRNEKIASFIPSGSSVIDLGCGAQTLKGHLRSGIEYQPCDLVENTPDVIVCDFNAGQFPPLDKRFTHVVCSGVLEYIRDHHRFLEECSSLGDTLVLSYNLRLPGDSKLQRMTNNWVNHFSRAELEEAFREADLSAECLDTTESGEVIYGLKRRNAGHPMRSRA